jgi:hypothetical protein
MFGVHEFRDAFLPYVGSELKDVFEELKEVRPDLVFTHPRPPPKSSPADWSGLAFADIRRAADDGPGQYDRMKLVPYAITSLLHAARPKLRAVPARSTGSMSTKWSTRSSPHPPGTISPREPGLGTGELVTIRLSPTGSSGQSAQESSPSSGRSRSATRNRPSGGRRTDEASLRPAGPNDTRRRAAVDGRLVPGRARARETVCPRPTRRMKAFTNVRLRGGRPSQAHHYSRNAPSFHKKFASPGVSRLSSSVSGVDWGHCGVVTAVVAIATGSPSWPARGVFAGPIR